MNVIQGLLQAISPLPDGDFSDRLNYCYTTTALVIASAFISGWSFVGSPIQCWFPAYYRGWWIEYAMDYCYVQNTYFVPFTEVKAHNAFDFGAHIVPIPKNITHREEKLIGYYQWVPFILAGQAILFYLPVVLWRALYNTSGFKVKAICDVCSISSNMDEDERKRNMQTVAGFLVYEHTVGTERGGAARKRAGGSLIVYYYLLIKVLYALNALLQFALLKGLLGVASYSWGLSVAGDLLAGREWPETGNFPRVTICDFSVRVLANLHRHSVQCVLMINMFNEKIFVALWFWLTIILATTLYSLFYWIFTTQTNTVGRALVTSYIHKIDPAVARSALDRRSRIDEFLDTKLRPDGIFLVRLISANSGDLVTCELLSALWKQFLAERRRVPPPYSEPLLVAKKDIDENEL